MEVNVMNSMPQSIRCEQEILGGIFNNPKIITEIIDEVDIDDFYKTSHQVIFSTISKLFAEGKDINITQFTEAIGKHNLESIGGITYLTELIVGGMPIKPKHYISIIKEKSYRRKVIKEFSKAIQEMHNEKSKPFDIVGMVMDKLTTVSEKRNLILSDSKLLETTLIEIEKRVNNGGEIPGMKTGLNAFDKNVGGLQKGELDIIAGRTSMGKTLFALNLADGLGENGYKVFLCELEMTEQALGMRRLSYNANVDAEKMKFGKLSEEEILKIFKTTNILSKRNNMFTDCTPGQSLLSIKAKAKAIKQTHGLDVVVIDHLTLMNIPEKGTRDLAIGEVTKGLKVLAKELDVCVLLLCQLSRAVEQRNDKRPRLSDLRESGNIEQDADLVAFMYRDEYYNKESKNKGILECIIGKQRNGRTGTIKFAYMDRYQKIGNIIY
jgi:replicative DNA helicase